uniref:Uncharacterized protein n=1 Tax=Anguilla anguilla TaxID=7936 RepID=A0A0E9QH63_ANGAN
MTRANESAFASWGRQRQQEASSYPLTQLEGARERDHQSPLLPPVSMVCTFLLTPLLPDSICILNNA